MTLAASTATRSPARARSHAAASVAAGVLLVALASQLAIPLPGTPVPMTLQPLAVLLVGGLLGRRRGAAALVVYLLLGAAGLPVFTPFGTPGLLRLFGPTGGYLLAFPFAAAVVGWVTARRAGWAGLVAGPFAGMLAIHLGGMAQLLALTGSVRAALAVGAMPFVLGDTLKVLVAAMALRRSIPFARALR
jgi:biotin transport system substrate-specific component